MFSQTTQWKEHWFERIIREYPGHRQYRQTVIISSTLMRSNRLLYLFHCSTTTRTGIRTINLLLIIRWGHFLLLFILKTNVFYLKLTDSKFKSKLPYLETYNKCTKTFVRTSLLFQHSSNPVFSGSTEY